MRSNRIAMLSDDRDETINHIIRECNKLAQREYNTRCDWVGKGNQPGTVQEIEIKLYYKMLHEQTRICLKEQ